jgi:hypothetical protein
VTPDASEVAPGEETAAADARPAPKFVGVRAAAKAATEILAKFGVDSPDDICVTRFAAAFGARVSYGAGASADGRTVHSGGKSWISIDLETLGSERARFTIAHELAHLVLHPNADAIERIHGGGPKLRMDHQYEREADAFAAELLLPEHLFACRACDEAPTLDHILELGRDFGTSLQATGRRYTTFATSACALVESDDGFVFNAAKSTSFRGMAFKNRYLEASSIAAAVTRGDLAGTERAMAVTDAWGRRKIRAHMTEDVVIVPESGVVAAWLWHAPSPRKRAPRR